MNKKIGILTFHYSLNEGAVLQCFSLLKFLQENYKDYNFEILDFRRKSKEEFINKNTELHKKRSIVNFQKIFPVSPKFYNEQQASEYINKNYEKIIVGSDAVWAFESYPRITPMQPGLPNFYFLPSSIKISKFSYGCSMGNSNSSLIPKSIIEELGERLSQFTLLSARDMHTKKFAELLSHAEVSKVPDPTFLCNFNECVDVGVLKNKISSIGIDFKKFTILVTDAEKNANVINFANKIKIKNKQILSTHKLKQVLSLESLELSPLEWSKLFGLVDLSIISRMHPAIMCLLQNKPFITFDNRIKTLDLFNVFGIQDSVFYKNCNVIKLVESWESFKIPQKIENYKTIGEKFIKRIFEN
jgi:hypothetical protein